MCAAHNQQQRRGTLEAPDAFREMALTSAPKG
jgi:hypothetical protein